MWKPAFGKDEGLPCLPMHFDLADPGIVAGAIDQPGLLAIHFSTDRLVLFAARDHRFARRKRHVPVRDLAALPAYARALDDLLAPHFKAS